MKFTIKTSNVLLFITIFTFFGVTSAKYHPKDILTNLKDDCGNVCGVINTNVKDSKCGDADKRNEQFLVVFDDLEKDEEKTEYFESLDYECVKECPKNYTVYKTTKICVKDPVVFEKELEDISNNTGIIESCKNCFENGWIYGTICVIFAFIIAICVKILYKLGCDSCANECEEMSRMCCSKKPKNPIDGSPPSNTTQTFNETRTLNQTVRVPLNETNQININITNHNQNIMNA